MAQSPVDSLCLHVNTDATVDLTWTIPDDVGPSNTFQIFRNQGAGFVGIATVPSTQNTYHDGVVNANAQTIKYFIRTLGSPETIESITASTIFLQLSSSNLGSVANLSWNTPYANMPAGSEFIVEKRINPGGFQPLTTIPTSVTSLKDTLYALCGAARTIDYRIIYEGPFCPSQSPTATGEFQDLLGPPVPEVETITTDPQTGDVTVYWYPVSSPDLAQYVVQNIDLAAQTYIDVGVVPAGEPTEFTYTSAPDDESTTFGVRAEDQCGNEQNFNSTYTTMFAEAFYTECDLEALIAWSSYEGWPQGVDKYVIHAIVDETDQVEFGSVTPNELFFNAPIEPNREYCFYVEAISLGDQRASTSNAACITTNYPIVPDHYNIATVSVIDNQAIEVTLANDPDAEGITYELFRAIDQGPFRTLGTTAATNSPTMSYIDTDVDVDNGVYTYYYKVTDGCGNTLGETNRGNNIVLHAIADSVTVSNHLNWNAYAEWPGGVGNYRIMRSMGSEEEPTVFATLDSDILEYDENVESFRHDQSMFCYRVEAVENSGGSPAQSLSNTVCIVQPPTIWIPNAMVVGGFNDEFKPIAGFIDFSSYRMEIFNKWGDRVFHTADIEEGWTGKYRGSVVRSDYYRYVIIYRDGIGKPYRAQGVMYVLVK